MKTIEIKVTVSSNGRLLVDLPIDMSSGEYNAVLILEDQPINTNQNPLKEAQKIFRQYVPPSRKLSKELLQERRKEALDE
jgi:hypothetical protein